VIIFFVSVQFTLFYLPELTPTIALKCRQKKKLWEKELQKYSDEVIQLNKSLRATVLQLKEEALMLKNQLLSHTE
jgi:hypothetical protein